MNPARDEFINIHLDEMEKEDKVKELHEKAVEIITQNQLRKNDNKAPEETGELLEDYLETFQKVFKQIRTKSGAENIEKFMKGKVMSVEDSGNDKANNVQIKIKKDNVDGKALPVVLPSPDTSMLNPKISVIFSSKPEEKQNNDGPGKRTRRQENISHRTMFPDNCSSLKTMFTDQKNRKTITYVDPIDNKKKLVMLEIPLGMPIDKAISQFKSHVKTLTTAKHEGSEEPPEKKTRPNT